MHCGRSPVSMFISSSIFVSIAGISLQHLQSMLFSIFEQCPHLHLQDQIHFILLVMGIVGSAMQKVKNTYTILVMENIHYYM